MSRNVAGKTTARPMTLDPKVGYSDISSANRSRSSTWNPNVSRSSARGKTTLCGISVGSNLEVMTSLSEDHMSSKLSSSVRLYNRTGKTRRSEEA
jgi:hypothetical protein